jgi:hypothetical protein
VHGMDIHFDRSLRLFRYHRCLLGIPPVISLLLRLLRLHCVILALRTRLTAVFDLAFRGVSLSLPSSLHPARFNSSDPLYVISVFMFVFSLSIPHVDSRLISLQVVA